MKNLTDFSAVVDVVVGLFLGALGGVAAALLFGLSWNTFLILTVALTLALQVWEFLKHKFNYGAVGKIARRMGDEHTHQIIDEMERDEARAFPRLAFSAGLAAGALAGFALPNTILGLLGIGS